MRRSIALLIVLCVASVASAQLRIVTMNASNFQSSNAQPRAGMNTILSAIGSAVSDDPRLAGNSGIARPIDVLCLQESFTPATTGAGYANLLNSIYGVSTYQFGTMTGATTGNGTQGIIYNSATVQLLGEAAIGTTGASGMARQEVRHRIRPVGYSSASADIYIYNGHWKSSAGDTARRLVEAQTIKADAASLPAGSNVIYLGDMNVTASTESGYAHLTSAGAGQAFDPINAPGSWNGAPSFKNIHTQSPWDSALNPGFNGATGGMDSRFDQQIVTAGLVDNEGLSYVSNSYFVIGNNGSHVLGQPLNTGSGAAPAVLDALSSILDHLPVSADYQLPAKMTVTQTAAAPSQVIVGGSATATIRVQNTAPVLTTNAADELDYTLTTTGQATGSFTSSTQATTAGNSHSVTFNTAAPGVKNATVSVTTTSQSAETVGSSTISSSTTVLAHSTPSLASGSTVTSQTIDFGIWAIGSTPGQQAVALHNRADPSGFTASLDLDGITPSGDTTRLPLTLATGAPSILPAANRAGAAALTTTNAGSFSAVYALLTSDQNLPGAINHSAITLTLVGRVALGGDADLSNTVDIDDFGILASNFNTPGIWQTGDFNRDGVANIDDFGILASNFNQSVTPAAGVNPRGVAAVPEPTGTIACVSILFFHRRRRA